MGACFSKKLKKNINSLEEKIELLEKEIKNIITNSLAREQELKNATALALEASKSIIEQVISQKLTLNINSVNEKIDLLEKEIKNIINNSLTREQELKNATALALEASIPIIEQIISQNLTLKQKKEVSELTKSFILGTMKEIKNDNKKLEEKIDEIDKKKINKQNLYINTKLNDENPLNFN